MAVKQSGPFSRSLRTSFPREAAPWQGLANSRAQRGARRHAISFIVLPDGFGQESQPEARAALREPQSLAPVGMTGDAKIKERQARRDLSRRHAKHPGARAMLPAALRKRFSRTAAQSASQKEFSKELPSSAAVWGLDWGWIIFFFSVSCFACWCVASFCLGCDSLLIVVLGWAQEGRVTAGLCR